MNKAMKRILGTVSVVMMLALAACDTPDDKGAVLAGSAEQDTGAHGVGLLVDNPDESSDVDDWPVCSDGAQHPDCRDAPLGY